MYFSESAKMQRSNSMPAHPRSLQAKPMIRSQEKETLVEEDYYPESPNLENRKISFSNNRDLLNSSTQSASNLISNEWAANTIETDLDPRRNEADMLYYRSRPYRVIEKNGRENVTFKKIPEKSWRYIRDFVTTLVRWVLYKRFVIYVTSSTVKNTSDFDNAKLAREGNTSEDSVQVNNKNAIPND